MRLLLDYRPALKQPTGVGMWVHELARGLLSLEKPAQAGADSLEITLFSSSLRDRLARSAIAELQGVRAVDCP